MTSREQRQPDWERVVKDEMYEVPGLRLRELREAEWDARVALPEAQERFQRAEAEVERLRDLIDLCAAKLEMVGNEEPQAVARRLREAVPAVSRTPGGNDG